MFVDSEDEIDDGNENKDCDTDSDDDDLNDEGDTDFTDFPSDYEDDD